MATAICSVSSWAFAGVGNSPQLIRCARPLGVAALSRDDAGYAPLYRLGLQSPLPMLRVMMTESGCFRVVDRGASSTAMQRERALARSGQLRSGSRMGKGQMVAADYIITPRVVVANENAGGTRFGGNLAGRALGGLWGRVVGSVGTKTKEATVTLYMVNVRSGVQEAAAEGSATKRDISLMGGGSNWDWGRYQSASVSSYSNTDIGKVVVAAFVDAHNRLVMQAQGRARR